MSSLQPLRSQRLSLSPGHDGVRSAACPGSGRRREERRKVDAGPAPQRCRTSRGGAGRATLVRTGHFTPPEGPAAGPGACKPQMQRKGAGASKYRAGSVRRAPQTRRQTPTSDLAEIRTILGHLQRDPRLSGGGKEPTFRASPGVAAGPAAPGRQGEGNRPRAGAAAPKQGKDFAGGGGNTTGGQPPFCSLLGDRDRWAKKPHSSRQRRTVPAVHEGARRRRRGTSSSPAGTGGCKRAARLAAAPVHPALTPEKQRGVGGGRG